MAVPKDKAIQVRDQEHRGGGCLPRYQRRVGLHLLHASQALCEDVLLHLVRNPLEGGEAQVARGAQGSHTSPEVRLQAAASEPEPAGQQAPGWRCPRPGRWTTPEDLGTLRS